MATHAGYIIINSTEVITVQTLNGGYEDDPDEPNRRLANELAAEVLRDIGFRLGSLATDGPIIDDTGLQVIQSVVRQYPCPIAYEN